MAWNGMVWPVLESSPIFYRNRNHSLRNEVAVRNLGSLRPGARETVRRGSRAAIIPPSAWL